jgi:hypothetical protein
MPCKICISIDVEPDCTPTWHYSSPLSFVGVTVGIKQILHPLFLKYKLKPTYLLNNVVLENKQCVEILKSLDGTMELGTHLHSEFIEPNKKYAYYDGIRSDANQCFLDPCIEFKKMENITKLFKNRFGYNPLSFRAGRFAAGKTTILSLIKLGYHSDSSVTPGVIWRKESTREKPIKYKTIENQPYFTSEYSFPNKTHKQTIVEIPVTIYWDQTTVAIIKRQIRKLIKRNENDCIWLRPSISTEEQMKAIIKKIKEKFENDRKQVVFNMMFHNVEVIPALSPYNQTENDCRKFITSLENVFKFCAENDIGGATMNEIYEDVTHTENL